MKNFKSKQQGLSLLELLLVMAVVAGILVVAFMTYPRVAASRAASDVAQTLSAAQATVKTIYTSGNYSTLTNLVANQAGVFPDRMKEENTQTNANFINEWDGGVDIEGADRAGAASTANARYFNISYENVPTAVCTRLVPATAGNFGLIRVDDNIVFDAFGDTAAADQGVLDEAAIVAACQGDEVTITWTAN